jgi:peptidoglycan/LPS O-acetylase OafA/YrhL
MVSPGSVTALPGPLRVAVWLLAAEAVAAAALAVLLAYQGTTGAPADSGAAWSLAGFTAVAGAGLAGLAVALGRRKARARAPAIVLQLLAVMLAVVLATGGAAGIGVPIAVLGVAVVTLLLAPSTTATLG